MAPCSTRRTANGSWIPSRSDWPGATWHGGFPELADAPVVETRVCQYETTPDTHFVIDRHPDFDNVWLVGGGSGHGFKHGPMIGRHVVGRLNGAALEPGEERFGLAHVRTQPGCARRRRDVGGWSDW